MVNDERLRDMIEHAINCTSAENRSNTPDFILAEFLTDCLSAFDKCSTARERWYGKSLSINASPGPDAPVQPTDPQAA